MKMERRLPNLREAQTWRVLLLPLQEGRGNEKPRKSYKFSKRERNRGTLVETGKRDRDTHDYNDEM